MTEIPRTYPSATPTPATLADELRALIARGLTSGEARNIFAEADQDAYPAYIAKAREHYHREGETEIDDAPEVSEASGGCYVAAWVWVSDAEAGVTPDDDEGEA